MFTMSESGFTGLQDVKFKVASILSCSSSQPVNPDSDNAFLLSRFGSKGPFMLICRNAYRIFFAVRRNH